MKIVLEGVDGSGKTTVAGLLSRKMGWQSYATPPASFQARRARVDAFATNEDHYQFYLEGIRCASRELDEFPAGTNVVVDRYWLTTLVYHEVMGVRVDPGDFAGIHQADVTFLFRVKAGEQARRLAIRGLSAGDVRMLQQQDALRDAYDRLVEPMRLVAVETDARSPEEICEEILNELSSR